MDTSSILPEKLEKLRGLETYLKEQILGQDHLASRVAAVLKAGELGLTKPGRPKGSFLFLGPTGVGKTELALTFTRHLFGDDKLLRFDMSEYQTQESLGILLGGRLGETGTLGQAIKAAGHGTLLFDEIEKAHSRVLDIFLQILDAARITMTSGETVDVSDFYVVFTSNIGGAEIIGLEHSPTAAVERFVLNSAQRSLRPELFARIDEKLVFRKLDFATQRRIVQKLVRAEVEFLKTRGVNITITEDVLNNLMRFGFDTRLGARPLRQFVERTLHAICYELLI